MEHRGEPAGEEGAVGPAWHRRQQTDRHRLGQLELRTDWVLAVPKEELAVVPFEAVLPRKDWELEELAVQVLVVALRRKQRDPMQVGLLAGPEEEPRTDWHPLQAGEHQSC